MRAYGTAMLAVGLLAAWAVADEGSILCLRSGGGDRLEAMSPDGAQRVVRLEAGDLGDGLAVSPDGRRVALAAGALCVLEPGQLLWYPHLAWSPRNDERPETAGALLWTPDGNGLVFTSGSGSVWATGVDGSNLRLLHRGDTWISRLGFDLDGRLLVENGGGARFAIDVETAHSTELALSDTEANELWALLPVWSPDGARLAYHWRGEALVRGANGQTTDLTQGRLGSVWPLFWTPGGEAVVCRSPGGKVWEVALDPTLEPRLLTRRAVPEAQIEGGWAETAWTAVPVEGWLPPPGPLPPATVNVTSEPSGADVFLDGHFKGRTPLQAPILSAGEVTGQYALAVVKDHLAGVTRNVQVCQGQCLDVQMRLSERLTDPTWPAGLAHVRSEVRRAILHRSPQLLGQFSASEVVFEEESSE